MKTKACEVDRVTEPESKRSCLRLDTVNDEKSVGLDNYLVKPKPLVHQVAGHRAVNGKPEFGEWNPSFSLSLNRVIVFKLLIYQYL